MNYQEMKREQEKELSDFEGIFYAFSDKQFNEGMVEVGLVASDTDKIYSLGAGGYILKEKSEAFHTMFKKFSDRMEIALKDKDFLLDALTYELCNHEYFITCGVDKALNALGLTLEGIKSLSFGADVLKKSCTEAMRSC
uniref:Uncharacterized protein n=1 Tax=viral metagenome TaxID=1070528 RepID=A0A6M3K1I8_9ZZZZ